MKFKFVPKTKNGILYYFKDRSAFERCVAKKCALIAPENSSDASDYELLIGVTVATAVEVWRLEKKIEKAKDLKTLENIESITDQIQRLKDVLRKHEIEIKDHTGDPYNDGMSVRPIHFEEDANIPEGMMKIIDTLKPSIYFKKQIISHGEVIVAKHKS